MTKEDGTKMAEDNNQKFSITACKKEYDDVLTFLQEMQKKSAQIYHRVLHDVYLAVT